MQKQQSNIVPTAAFIIIGNEILDGSTREGNLVELISRLNSKGISLKEVRVVRDEEAAITSAVKHCSNNYDYVFTSGGIGPTHDDITAAAIAKCFEVELLLNEDALSRLNGRYNDPSYVNDAVRKMAYIPANAQLIDNKLSAAPGFILRNIYVLAGVPSIFQAMLDFIFKSIPQSKRLNFKSIQVNAGESRIAADLSMLDADNPELEIGSYPRKNATGEYSVKVVFRSYDMKNLYDSVETFQKALASKNIKSSEI